MSLIICTTGAPHRLDLMVRQAMASLDRPGGPFEVVIVDNSPAGLDIGVDDPRVRIVRSALPGLSRARTVGSIHAQGDVLVFTDDDVVFPPQWPAAMAAPLLDGSLDAAAAPVRLAVEFDAVDSKVLREWLAEGNLDGSSPRLIGAGMAIRRDLLGQGLWDQQIGAGHPDFAFGEETLFEAMIREAGARVGVVTDAEVVHRPDAGRANEDAWRDTARRKAWSEAYLGYHWRGESLRRPLLRLMRRWIRLRAHRTIGRRDERWFPSELTLIQALEEVRAFRALAGSERAYTRRAKVVPVPVPAPATRRSPL